MSDILELEAAWLELGHRERHIQETIATLKTRAKLFRADGEHAAADEIADAIVALNVQLRDVDAVLRKVEPAYFAALNSQRRKS